MFSTQVWAVLPHFTELKKQKQESRINWAKRRPPESGQEVLEQQRSKGTGSDQHVGVSPEGRERGGKEKEWETVEVAQRGRGESERGGWRGGGCALCEM